MGWGGLVGGAAYASLWPGFGWGVLAGDAALPCPWLGWGLTALAVGTVRPAVWGDFTGIWLGAGWCSSWVKIWH